MTREEREQALEWFKNRPITMSGAKKMYDLAISALEQPEPCENTVSRKAVEEMLKNGFPARGMWEIEGDVVKQTICETLADALMELEGLPSAQPEPKEGHWIEGGTYRDVIECYCSECGQIMTTAATVRMNYCPRCGADMRGEQHG